MTVETVNYIADMVITNPANGDAKKEGDDHIRNIKKGLTQCFRGFTGAILCTGTDGGAADAYTLTPSAALVAYSTRLVVLFSPVADNLTTSPTLNISGLGAKAIKRINGASVVAGELVTTAVYMAIYNGAEFRLISPTKQYIDQLAFTSALPSLTGNSLKHLRVTSDETAAEFTTMKTVNGASLDGSGDIATGLVLLATLTPTAAANVDFLSTFTADYDKYLITGRGLNNVSGTDTISVRLANAGVVDSGSNYSTVTISSASSTTFVTSAVITGNSLNTQRGLNFDLVVNNVNDATNLKNMIAQAISQDQATPRIQWSSAATAYIGGAVTGFRLFWTGGASFAAQGKVRVYGYQNS